MKKQILFIALFLSFLQSVKCQSLQQLSFKTISGDNVSLSSYSGKRVLFVIAPLSQNDPVFSELQSFKNRYQDTIAIIGVVSFEDGYQSSNASSMQALYSNSGIVLTEGMYTKKSSGSNQSEIMKWLSDKNRNYHFDMDSQGIGQKFFVSGAGRLFAVLPPQISLSAAVIDSIVHSN